MPQAANIVLPDGQATPVNHTFVPLGNDISPHQIFWWENVSATSALGNERLSIELKRPKPSTVGTASTKDRVYRVVATLYLPALETLATADSGLVPPPQVAYAERVRVEMILPERGNQQRRKDARTMMKNLFMDAQFVAVVEQLLSIY